MLPQRPNVGLLLFLFVALFAANIPKALGQIAPISLTTSEAEALTTLEVKLDLSPTRQQYMTVDFGFATDEAEAFEGFFDSFSMTLQKRDQASASALFFTVDRTGLQLAPNNPGGIVLSSLPYVVQMPSPSFLTEFDYHVAYQLSVVIPSGLGAPDSLFFDLFSNQNGVSSIGYMRNLRIWPPPVVVQSTTLLNGIFTDEPDAYLDLVAMTTDVPKIRPVQFFRVRGDIPVKLTLTAVKPDGLEFDYEFRPNRLVLMEAPNQNGPYTPIADQEFDLKTQTTTVFNGIEAKYYRIESDVPVTILSVEPKTGPAKMAFRFEAGPMTLLTSQVVGGPYVDSVDATFNGGARTVRAPRSASRQVFRLSSEAGYKVKSIQNRPESWLLHIE